VTVAQGFDDHPTVVALEFLVKRLIVRDCLRGGAPDSALAELQDAMKVHRELLLRLAFGPDAGSDETTLNAVSAAAEFDRIGKEIAEDLRDAKG